MFTVLPAFVAQTCSLLYRRFVTCGSCAKSRVLGGTEALPITNRRYGRLKICATVNRYPTGEGTARPVACSFQSGGICRPVEDDSPSPIRWERAGVRVNVLQNPKLFLHE